MGITGKRKIAFARRILEQAGSPIGFADVGSGGPLKAPWSYLPGEFMRKIDFEPTDTVESDLPLCISKAEGTADFHVAHDERASSFHEANPEFVERFGQQSMLPKKTIRVRRTTLDKYFAENYEAVDALDINVEGHDLQVLQGAESLLANGCIKLLKVEFELAPAWKGQGWFSDIDTFMRARGFDLADIEIEFGRPANVAHFYSKGEPVWGKAYYVPSADRWKTAIESRQSEGHVMKAAALYCAAGVPGRAFDVLDIAAPYIKNVDVDELKRQIAHVFQWAKLEEGIATLGRLGGAISRSITRS